MISLFSVNMPEEVDKPLLKTIHSGYITEGPQVKEFEQKLSRLVGTQHVAAVNSGTSALTLALRLAGVGPGDEVITTPMTCSATNLPILNCYAKPVWADIDPITGNIDPGDVERKITPLTKAIMVVDWGGRPADLNVLMRIAEKHDIKLIEDAAHALGAKYYGEKIGSMADFTCFSFQAIKHLTTVDGGAITCRSYDDYVRAKKLRWFGIDREAPTTDTRIGQDIEEAGYKFHMNDVTATIGLVGLKNVDDILKRRAVIAARYDDELSIIYGRPKPDKDVVSANWLYTVLLPTIDLPGKFKDFMERRGVMVSKVHRRCDQYSVFRKYSWPKTPRLPGVSSFYDRMMCIPVHQNMNDREVKIVIRAANDFIKEVS